MAARGRRLVGIRELHESIPHDTWGPRADPDRDGAGFVGIGYSPFIGGGESALEEHVVILYVRGETQVIRTIQGERQAERVGPGCFSFHPAATESSWGWEDPIEVIHLYVLPSRMRHLLCTVHGDAASSELAIREVLVGRDPEIAAIVEEMVEEMSLPKRAGAELMCRAHADRILVHLLRSHIIRADAEGDERRLVRKAMALVEDQLDRDLRLETLSESLEVDRQRLQQIFKAETGITIHAYVVERRLERARNLLDGTSRSVGDIALATGFADQSHLTRAFKRQHGVPPGRWREHRRARQRTRGLSQN